MIRYFASFDSIKHLKFTILLDSKLFRLKTVIDEVINLSSVLFRDKYIFTHKLLKFLRLTTKATSPWIFRKKKSVDPLNKQFV